MGKMLKDAVVVAYGRAPIARSVKGSLKDVHPVEYASAVLKGVLNKAPALPPEMIEDIIVGCAKPEGPQGMNIARLIGLRAGLPYQTPGQTVNRFCASGLQAVSTAANMIMSGQSEAIVAGGVESMSLIPMGGFREEYKNQWIMEHEPGGYMAMGITAENVALRYGITRDAMEIFALESHRKAALAQGKGYFANEIIPVQAKDNAGAIFTLQQDEGIRKDVSKEKMAALKPSFKTDGSVTAATSSQTSDSAAMLVLMEREKAESLGIKPLARFVSFAVAGVDPAYMGLGPVLAVPKVMRLAGLSLEEMDVIELNEAFAAQAIACAMELALDMDKVNPQGGAIALGHPLGATGAILCCKALNYLERTRGRYGLITMCIGGGMGAAGILERLEP